MNHVEFWNFFNSFAYPQLAHRAETFKLAFQHLSNLQHPSVLLKRVVSGIKVHMLEKVKAQFYLTNSANASLDHWYIQLISVPIALTCANHLFRLEYKCTQWTAYYF